MKDPKEGLKRPYESGQQIKSPADPVGVSKAVRSELTSAALQVPGEGHDGRETVDLMKMDQLLQELIDALDHPLDLDPGEESDYPNEEAYDVAIGKVVDRLLPVLVDLDVHRDYYFKRHLLSGLSMNFIYSIGMYSDSQDQLRGFLDKFTRERSVLGETHPPIATFLSNVVRLVVTRAGMEGGISTEKLEKLKNIFRVLASRDMEVCLIVLDYLGVDVRKIKNERVEALFQG